MGLFEGRAMEQWVKVQQEFIPPSDVGVEGAKKLVIVPVEDVVVEEVSWAEGNRRMNELLMRGK